MLPDTTTNTQEDLLGGFIYVSDYMGTDNAIADIARISYNSVGTVESNCKLLNHLMKSKHYSCFEHAIIRFEVKCPLPIRTQWIRHRIGSFNELSRRYVEVERKDFYISNDYPDEFVKVTDYCFTAYKDLLQKGVRKELARFLLPQNLFTGFSWTVNLRSLMNFINLRNSIHAQQEMRQYAYYVDLAFEELFPITYKAFKEYGYREN